MGWVLIIILLDRFVMRMAYEIVIPIDEIINNVSKHSSLEEIIFSMIMSFE